jgi:ribosome maturation factor RimP
MALDLNAIRAAADRVAASHGLEIVELEFGGGGKSRALRIFLEKDAAGREALKASVDAGEMELPSAYLDGTLSMEHLSGVTHEDCAKFSHDFGTLLDMEDLVPGAEYTLEVSSPGLERKLSSREDFVRFEGSVVKLSTFDPVEGSRHWQGRMSVTEDGRVALDLTAVKQKGKAKKATVEAVTVELKNVEKANLVPEF